MRLTLLCALVVLAFALADGPTPPKFLNTRSAFGEHYAIEVYVQIVPHPDIRHVTLEAWTAHTIPSPFDEADGLAFYEIGDFITGDSQPVTELNQEQRTFRFFWRSGLDAGAYYLVAKVAVKDYRPVKETRKLIQVL